MRLSVATHVAGQGALDMKKQFGWRHAMKCCNEVHKFNIISVFENGKFCMKRKWHEKKTTTFLHNFIPKLCPFMKLIT